MARKYQGGPEDKSNLKKKILECAKKMAIAMDFLKKVRISMWFSMQI